MYHNNYTHGIKLHIHGPSTKRTVRGVVQDGLKQLFATLVIFGILLIAMNFPALYQITQYKIAKAISSEDSPLNELTETKEIKNETLKVSSDPEVLKSQIPQLNIDITPTDNRIVIPRIDKNIPIVRVTSENLIKRDFAALEAQMQDALENGVVHYPGTSIPGESGNFAVTGHSSYFPWDPGRFKDVFALLHDVVEGDKIVVYWNQEKYVYEVSGKEVVMPDEVEVLKSDGQDKLTLVTCTPIGTNLKRLIVTATPVKEEVVVSNGKILR